MNSKLVMKAMIGFYVFLFSLYLFGPLLVMSITAFNTPNYPQAWPFEAFMTAPTSAPIALPSPAQNFSHASG